MCRESNGGTTSKEPRKPHYLCNKIHEKGNCTQQCKGCRNKGSHLEENCWTLYPDKKPKFNTPKIDRRGKERGRSRSKSVEKEEKGEGKTHHTKEGLEGYK